jgi:6-pyruvoyl-tetrahydropterin synthase
MFEMYVKRTFPAVHALSNDGELIEEPHEHAWVCEVTFASKDVDASGMLADFRDVDAIIDQALSPLTSRTLHTATEFSGTSASAENIAKFLHDALKPSFGHKLVRVQVWEDAEHGAAYYE